MASSLPLIARSARAGQFVRVLGWDKGELIPLTLADWNADKGTIDLVVQDLGSSSAYINRMQTGEAIAGTPGLNGQPQLLQGFLEMSNVKVVDEMVNMITAQRAYESNSKAIQAADDMLQLANNVKR